MLEQMGTVLLTAELVDGGLLIHDATGNTVASVPGSFGELGMDPLSETAQAKVRDALSSASFASYKLAAQDTGAVLQNFSRA